MSVTVVSNKSAAAVPGEVMFCWKVAMFCSNQLDLHRKHIQESIRIGKSPGWYESCHKREGVCGRRFIEDMTALIVNGVDPGYGHVTRRLQPRVSLDKR
jgi:hypothetical protein